MLYLHDKKHEIMTTYQIRINDSTVLGKNIVALLQSIPQVVKFEKHKEFEIAEDEETISKEELLASLNSAFSDVKLMMDGKKRKIPAEELLYELQNGL